MSDDITFRITGEAGQGMQSIGKIICKALAKGGIEVFANQDYESRIRGGCNHFDIRARDWPVYGPADEVDILVALSREGVRRHLPSVAPDGAVIFDSDQIKNVSAKCNVLAAPLERIAKKAGGSAVMSNTVGAGVALGLIGCEITLVNQVLRSQFRSKGKEVVDANLAVARAGHDYARAHTPDGWDRRMDRRSVKHLLMRGNDAIAVGAITAGCKFASAYPMTPSTSISEYLAMHADKCGLVFEQAEDEISALIMAQGAATAGARAMVATSGGGIALMVEGVSLAAATETPIVIIDAMRPGPATGLPTRTEQADLEFVIHAGHGEFARVVLAPGTAEQAFECTLRAFNLAEAYQIPVFVLTDQHLADQYRTVEAPELAEVPINRGALLPPGEVPEGYARHAITRSGVSPRALPGKQEALVVTAGDEHDERGFMIEAAKPRVAQVDKRLRKVRALVREMGRPSVYGPRGADIGLLCWGSTYGACREAIDLLRRDGYSVAMVHFTDLWPFPARAVESLLSRYLRLIDVEGNATAQLAHLLRAETGMSVDATILRYDGRPFSPSAIAKRVKEEIG